MEFNNCKERKSFINALIAKNFQELAELELTDKTEIKVSMKLNFLINYVEIYSCKVTIIFTGIIIFK